MARRYRNRRIGEFFKELDLTEGRCTGIPKMRTAMERNGSPEPRFSTDETRTHFAVELPVHPELVGLVLKDEAHDEAHDGVHDLSDSERRVLRMLRNAPRSVPEIVAEFGHAALSGGLKQAIKRLTEIGFVALTLRDSPRSKNQKRQLTDKGRHWLKENGGNV